MKTQRIGPQPGPQRQFLASRADLTFYGGAAGGGKTWSLLFSPLRSIHRQDFQAVIFRNTTPEIRNPGGMWDESMQLYPLFGGQPRDTFLDWSFPSGAYFKFAGLQYEKDLMDWQGSQIPFIGFDQVENFSRRKFFYMLSRNRSVTGIPGYVQATCNPDPDSWVARFIGWWINQDTGLPIAERSGVIRWFVDVQDEVYWADAPTDLVDRFGPSVKPKSVTFIPSKLSDNKILMSKDPAYEANLRAMPLVDQERLLHGNWKIRPAPGLYARREWFPIVAAAPAGTQWVRRWDFAGTKKTDTNDPDWTVGVKFGKMPDGRYVVGHVARMQVDPFEVRQAVKNLAAQDGVECTIVIPQDPGQAGKFQAQDFALMLAGYNVKSQRETGDKETRFGPASSQARAGNIALVKGDWNDAYLSALESFPEHGRDEADATSGALMEFTGNSNALIEYMLEQKRIAEAAREAEKNQRGQPPIPPRR